MAKYILLIFVVLSTLLDLSTTSPSSGTTIGTSTAVSPATTTATPTKPPSTKHTPTVPPTTQQTSTKPGATTTVPSTTQQPSTKPTPTVPSTTQQTSTKPTPTVPSTTQQTSTKPGATTTVPSTTQQPSTTSGATTTVPSTTQQPSTKPGPTTKVPSTTQQPNTTKTPSTTHQPSTTLGTTTLSPPSGFPCPIPQLRNGFINHTHSDDSQHYPPGANLTYTCDKGFWVIGKKNGVITCNVSGTWEPKIDQCNVVDCGWPGPIHNGNVSVPQNCTKYNCIASYRCKRNFAYNGKTVVWIKCLERGEWNMTVAACTPTAGPTSPQNRGVAVALGILITAIVLCILVIAIMIACKRRGMQGSDDGNYVPPHRRITSSVPAFIRNKNPFRRQRNEEENEMNREFNNPLSNGAPPSNSENYSYEVHPNLDNRTYGTSAQFRNASTTDDSHVTLDVPKGSQQSEI
ncbi:unnamed protein product [Owenia fusiformis]|uniref:Sushi domain-containing protein n=1 Tax=Owenia fusiformis TaxID=6347 RepID=A0A8S4Q4P9_OWEFU|nr:unnamed protein product [Owenia fusiformis]